MSDPTRVNPYADTTYARQVLDDLREDARCSECGGFEPPYVTTMDTPECFCGDSRKGETDGRCAK